jgi:hypothetical protein
LHFLRLPSIFIFTFSLHSKTSHNNVSFNAHDEADRFNGVGVFFLDPAAGRILHYNFLIFLLCPTARLFLGQSVKPTAFRNSLSPFFVQSQSLNDNRITDTRR